METLLSAKGLPLLLMAGLNSEPTDSLYDIKFHWSGRTRGETFARNSPFTAYYTC